jgi:hypothetical protein
MKMPETLRDAIEAERQKMGRAEALLACMAIAIEYGEADSPDAPDYVEVVHVASELLRTAIDGLDSLNLDKALR